MAVTPSSSTADLILDAAERRAQSVGFNGFSYADIADELKVTTATIHYHFSAKSDLGADLLHRYAQRFREALADIIRREHSSVTQLRAYARLYEDVLSEGRLCLCGILAAEYETLPAQMREQIVAFFASNEAWLANVLQAGRERGELRFAGETRDHAMAIICGLEGALLVARAYGGVTRFRVAAEIVLSGAAPAVA
ncbi:MAG: TetR family transcriptional regulator [Terricaulis sp.]